MAESLGWGSWVSSLMQSGAVSEGAIIGIDDGGQVWAQSPGLELKQADCQKLVTLAERIRGGREEHSMSMFSVAGTRYLPIRAEQQVETLCHGTLVQGCQQYALLCARCVGGRRRVLLRFGGEDLTDGSQAIADLGLGSEAAVTLGPAAAPGVIARSTVDWGGAGKGGTLALYVSCEPEGVTVAVDVPADATVGWVAAAAAAACGRAPRATGGVHGDGAGGLALAATARCLVLSVYDNPGSAGDCNMATDLIVGSLMGQGY